MTRALVFERSGRQPRAIAILCAIWTLLLFLYLRLDAAPWIIGIFAVFTLPALWDQIANPGAGMRFEPAHLIWHSGRRDAQIPWSQIDHVRLDTRLDFSVRATIVLVTGKRVRAPFEATPPADTLVAALDARGVRVERHHFSLLG